VQNPAVAVSVAVLRIWINGAPLFDIAMMADRYRRRQGNYADFSWTWPVSIPRPGP
jgi:hypothetical protein